jgi:hypothetical protein
MVIKILKKNNAMEIEYNYWTGNFNDVKTSLIRSVAQYNVHYSKIKIGITNDPPRRLIEHEKTKLGWKKMIIKYHTSSVNYINEMEKIIIAHHWDIVENEVNGGGGPNGKTPPYYLYVLLK